MATQASLPSPDTLASDMTLFDLDETLCLLMESAAEAAEANNGETPDDLRAALLDYCEAFGVKRINPRATKTAASRRFISSAFTFCHR